MKDLKKLIEPNQEMQNQMMKIKRELVSERKLIQYMKEHDLPITEEMIDNSLMNLLTFNDQYFKCEGCKGLEWCQQDHIGYRPELVKNPDFIHLVYKSCQYQKEHEYKQAIASNIKAFYMPKNILNASFDQLDLNSRHQALSKVLNFASTYNSKTYQKGVYLYGPFGVGKTFILAAMANKLAKSGIKVAFVYLPDLIRELKSAIGSNKLESLMDHIKNVQVLVLDDIGAEMNSAWVRDEIVGPLLQYRLLEELPTFFTSNKSMEELIADYARTTDGTIDKSKASRIGDRIKSLASEVYVEGKNYRY